MNDSVLSSSQKYYLANRQRILAKSKENYNKRTEKQRERTREYQREYYKHLRSVSVIKTERLPYTKQVIEKPKPEPIPAVKDNRSDVTLKFN